MLKINHKRKILTGELVIWKLILINGILIANGLKQQHSSSYQYRCSDRLEVALEHMLRRNQMKSGSRTSLDLSPYSVYHAIYNNKNKQYENIDENNSNEFITDDDDNSKIHHDKRFRSSNQRNTKLNEKLDTFYKYHGNNINKHNYQNDDRNYDMHQQYAGGNSVNRVEVADLKVRLPNKSRWVHVDKCQFSANNRTLDTRLIFPDLTISGKVVLHPTGGKCNMILRLRRAGIEFHTIPLQTSTDESRRSGTASVRTDSHFAEPGFLSVFAHGCQGPTGIKFRQNSKRRLFNRHDYQKTTDQQHLNNNNNYVPVLDPISNTRSKRYNSNQNRFEQSRYSEHRTTDNFDTIDTVNLNDDIFNLNDDHIQQQTNLRTFDDIFRNGFLFNIHQNGYEQQNINHNRHPHHNNPNQWHNFNENNFHPETAAESSHSGTDGDGDTSTTDSEKISDALSSELEQLFSMGVRGMLTTYMQKALQPAIKETLMENMGYTLSYG